MMNGPIGMRNLSLATLLAFCFVLLSAGQEPITKEIWERYHRRAQVIIQSTSHRIRIIIHDRKSDGEPWRPYSESVIEIIPDPYRTHFFGKSLETIQIGKILYARQPGGTWSLKEKEPAKGTVKYLGTTSESYSIEKEVQNDKDTAYTMLRDGTFVILRGEARNKVEYLSDRLIFERHDFGAGWFDDEGRYVKTESQTYDPRRKVFIRRVEKYEYDPSIRIEAPIPN